MRTKNRLSRVWDESYQDVGPEGSNADGKTAYEGNGTSKGVVESPSVRKDLVLADSVGDLRRNEQVRRLVEKWLLNSNVLRGKFIQTHHDLAETISDSLGISVSSEEIADIASSMKQFIRKSLSASSKVELVSETLGLALQTAHADRSRAVELYERTQDSLQSLVEDIRKRVIIEQNQENERVLEALRKGEKYTPSRTILNPYENKTVRSLLFIVQQQLDILLRANQNIVTITEKLAGFGTTPVEKDAISRILRAQEQLQGVGDSHSITLDKLLQIAGSVSETRLPTETGNLNMTYQDFVQSEACVPKEEKERD